jgi:nicotinamidase-related amidase
MNTCLVMVDMQNDYFPGGTMELAGIEDAAENARILLTEFRKKQLPIIHIQHISIGPEAFFFLPETDGAKINDMVAPHEGETVVVKNYPNSFRDTPLLEILRNGHINDLVICGAMSHMCIDATTRAAFDLGFNCIVVEDACATMDLFFNNKTIKASEVHASFMAALSYPYAKVVLTGAIVKERGAS